MIPAAFDYVRASSAEEAISLLGEHGDEAKFLAGGHSLLLENPNPTEEEVRLGLEGNLCRCTGYHNIVKSVLAAASGANS